MDNVRRSEELSIRSADPEVRSAASHRSSRSVAAEAPAKTKSKSKRHKRCDKCKQRLPNPVATETPQNAKSEWHKRPDKRKQNTGFRSHGKGDLDGEKDFESNFDLLTLSENSDRGSKELVLRHRDFEEDKYATSGRHRPLALESRTGGRYAIRRSPQLDKLWETTKRRRGECKIRRQERLTVLRSLYRTRSERSSVVSVDHMRYKFEQLFHQGEGRKTYLKDRLDQCMYDYTMAAHRDEHFANVIRDAEAKVSLELLRCPYTAPYFKTFSAYEPYISRGRSESTDCTLRQATTRMLCNPVFSVKEASTRLLSLSRASPGRLLFDSRTDSRRAPWLDTPEYPQLDPLATYLMNKMFESWKSLQLWTTVPISEKSLLEDPRGPGLDAYARHLKSLSEGDLEKGIEDSAWRYVSSSNSDMKWLEFVGDKAGRLSVLLFVNGVPVREYPVQASERKKMGWNQTRSGQPHWHYQESNSLDWIYKETVDGDVIGRWMPEGDIDWSEDLERSLLDNSETRSAGSWKGYETDDKQYEQPGRQVTFPFHYADCSWL